jgi:hypothetical protein
MRALAPLPRDARCNAATTTAMAAKARRQFGIREQEDGPLGTLVDHRLPDSQLEDLVSSQQTNEPCEQCSSHVPRLGHRRQRGLVIRRRLRETRPHGNVPDAFAVRRNQRLEPHLSLAEFEGLLAGVLLGLELRRRSR